MRTGTYQAVIARYREDLGWTDRLDIPFRVYNKGPDRPAVPRASAWMDLPNLGREGGTYLRHIADHYDDLPDFLVLLQGHPFDHCPNLYHVLENHCDEGKLIPLSGNWKKEALDGDYNWEGFADCLRGLRDQIAPGLECARYATGAQYIVPRAWVRARPRQFYRDLLPRLESEVSPLEGWAMERLWPYVFGAADRTGAIQVDVVLVGGASGITQRSLEHAIARCKTVSGGQVEFRVSAPPNPGAAYRRALDESQDFVLFARSGHVFDPESFTAALPAYYELKMRHLRECEPTLSFDEAAESSAILEYAPIPAENHRWQFIRRSPSSFFLHRSMLLQQWRLFSSGADLEAISARWVEQGLPLFAPSPSLLSSGSPRPDERPSAPAFPG
jgi:hypothetical protein